MASSNSSQSLNNKLFEQMADEKEESSEREDLLLMPEAPRQDMSVPLINHHQKISKQNSL